MKKSPTDDQNRQRAPRTGQGAPDDEATRKADEVQPPPTGANRGSPAAPVMKQFQKTRSESTGRS